MKQLGAFFLLIFILVGSTDIIINQHFCNDELESIAFFVKAQPCEHATDKNDLPPCHAKKVNDKNTCCSENNVVVEAVDWLKVLTEVQIKIDIVTIAPFVIKDPVLTENYSTKYSLQKIPKPPDESGIIYVEHQAFLI